MEHKKVRFTDEPPENPVPTIQQVGDLDYEEFERTLAIIKPNTISKARAIELTVKQEGLMVLKKKRVHMKPEQVREFYIQSLDEENNKYYKIFREMMATSEKTSNGVPDIRAEEVEKRVENSDIREYINLMTSGPCQVWIIAGRGAVGRFLALLGPADPKLARILRPDSIRARYGCESVLRNGVHGSESGEVAEKEIRFFFPDVPDCGGKGSGEYLARTVNPVLLKGLIQLCRQKPDNPLVWLADWLLANNPNANN